MAEPRTFPHITPADATAMTTHLQEAIFAMRAGIPDKAELHLAILAQLLTKFGMVRQ
jgi:hypothetical protein